MGLGMPFWSVGFLVIFVYNGQWRSVGNLCIGMAWDGMVGLKYDAASIGTSLAGERV